jgi:lipopolysaccharide/colanic/teichoic acid biosynthesis glycosyltransferase
LAKRIFDLVVGTILAITAVPVVLVFALVVAVELRAWPFFSQTRVGRHGRSFGFLKLRTLTSFRSCSWSRSGS